MQIFDKKYRLFGVINVIDLLVVVALVVAGLVVWKLLWGGSSTKPTADLVDVEYTILCSPLRNFSDSQIQPGGPVSTKLSGKSIGTIVSVRSNPTPGDGYSVSEQKAVSYESTFFRDAYIKVKAKGERTATGISVGDTQIHSNEVLAIVTPTFQCDTAILTDFKIGGE